MVSVKDYTGISLLLLLSLVPVSSSAQGTWERIYLPTNQFLKSVCFVDSLYGWIAGDSGLIFHTTDGGLTWLKQDTHSTHEVQDVFFLDRNQGWGSMFNFTTLPFGTVMLRTNDGGANWISQPYPVENIFMTCILFRDSLNGWMGGQPHALVRTTDGGASWTQAAIDTSILAFFPVLSIQFYNEQYGYASGGMFDIAGVTWHTSNGGEMWYAIDPSQAPADEVHGLHLYDSVNVIGAGGDPDFGYGVGMIRTSDGGENWSYEELVIQGNAYDLDFLNDHEVWAPLGPRRKLIYSLDGAATWTEIPSTDSTAIYDVTFPDSLHGFAVGKEGAVLKFRPRVIPSVQPIPLPQTEYVLYQNKPNPANRFTSIRYMVPSAGVNKPGNHQSVTSLQLKVYNIFGKEVVSLINSPVSSGDHEIMFDAANLTEGIYLYVLQVVNAGQTKVVAGPKRMIVQKVYPKFSETK